MSESHKPVALRHIELDEIDLDDTTFQFRLGATDAKDLRASLAAEGQMNPISVMTSENGYRLIDGFRRTVAANALGWTTIHAALYPAMTETEAKKVAYTKNVMRKNLSRTERANAMQLGRRQGLSVEEVAKLFNVSARTVGRYLALPPEVLQYVDGKTVTMAHGEVLTRELGGTEDAGQGIADAAAEVASEKLTTVELSKRLRVRGKGRRGRKRRYAQVKQKFVRVHSFKMTAATPTSELLEAADRLSEAAEVLRRLATALENNKETYASKDSETG